MAKRGNTVKKNQPAKGEWVTSYDVIAKTLGVARKTLNQWRSEYPDAPKPRQNGNHSIRQWEKFVERNGLKGAPSISIDDDDLGDADALPSITEVKIRKTLLEIREKELTIAEREEKLSDPTDQIRRFGLAVTAINTALANLVARCAPKMVGLKDPIEAREILEEEVELVRASLRDFDFEG